MDLKKYLKKTWGFCCWAFLLYFVVVCGVMLATVLYCTAFGNSSCYWDIPVLGEFWYEKAN